jgi:hypothetical protein
MTAKVYAKTLVRNEKTGQVKASYIAGEPFSLIARGLSNLRGKDSGTEQDWGNRLKEYHYLRIKTMKYVEEGQLVAKVTDADGKPYLNDDMQFVILGVTPTYDAFGSFIEYDIIANKAEVSVKLVDELVSSFDVTGVVS